MPDCSISPGAETHHRNAHPDAWSARLSLGFGNQAGTTRLLQREHAGPLRVQKALYPEHPSVCHAIVVHPPGGVVGGDQLRIEARVGQGAHALLTSPGAAKWYRANGRPSELAVVLDIGPGASLEWLPQESIFFDRADALIEQSISLADDARYLGCEIICLGRRAAGERFGSGSIRQRTTITRAGRLLWWEQGRLATELVDSPLGLAGKTVCATMIAVGSRLPAPVLAALRGLCDEPLFGVSQLPDVLTVRYLGDDSEVARELMLAAWGLLRPALLGRPPCELRSWRT
jgi:urease accessory protein